LPNLATSAVLLVGVGSVGGGVGSGSGRSYIAKRRCCRLYCRAHTKAPPTLLMVGGACRGVWGGVLLCAYFETQAAQFAV
jgi:hypothetical protein